MNPARARVSEARSERLVEDLLDAQKWDLRRHPLGDVLVQQEYRDYPSIREALARCSKSGPGEGIPDYILVDRGSSEPLAVIETKAYIRDLPKAISDVTKYGDAFFASGFRPLAIAVAGTRDERFDVRVLKRRADGWQAITYDNAPITWIPNRDQLDRARASADLTDLRPAVPPVEVLKAKAEEINGLLRESGLKDDLRPAAIGAIMLALWKKKGNIRRDKTSILADINQACAQAFWDAGKPDLAQSLRVDEANEKLAVRARRICEILERLNITTLTSEHDYIGALYEEFFRYTGGNTIGQYFTPRHVAKLMADLCNVTAQDTVIDIACGTGGFLIAAMHRMQESTHLPHDQIITIVKDHLIGIDDEPVTAALCVANMILRGDGSTGVRRADAFSDAKFPFTTANVGLMNPPFPHRSTDVPPERFIERLLAALSRRGLAATIVPSSLLVKRDKAAWRKSILSQHSLVAVVSLPDELFQPYASTNTAIVVLEKGVPHAKARQVFFCRIDNDGFRLKKGVRVPTYGSQMDAVLREFHAHGSVPGFSKTTSLDKLDNWAPGAYIDARPMTDEDLRNGVAELIRAKVAFMAKFAPQLEALKRAIDRGEFALVPYKRRRPAKSAGSGNTIADLFDVTYGQKALHSKEHLEPGVSLVISSSGADNGCYGFFDFPDLIPAPFVTVPSTGSIGEASVQEFACGVTDDCLLLFPKEGTPFEALYVAAATLRHERWRFNYGRKMTPDRIGGFPLRLDSAQLAWLREQWQQAERVGRAAIRAFAETSDVASAVPSDDRGDPTDFEERFNDLADTWERERPRGVDIVDMVTHPAYQQIIGMGARAVPLLLDRLQRKGGHWFWALHAITGVNPVPPEHYGDTRAMADAWLAWGREHAT